MANFFEQFFTPTSAAYRDEAAAETRKIQSYGDAMQRYRDFLAGEEKQGISKAIEVLGRTGQLNATSLAKAVAMLGQTKMIQLSEAQMQADAAREAARLRREQLGDYAETALVGDIAGSVMKVGSIALGAYAAGAPLAAAAVAAQPALGIAGQAAKPGMSAGMKLGLSGLADALGQTGGSYLGLAKEQIAEPGVAQMKQQNEWLRKAYLMALGYDPEDPFGLKKPKPVPRVQAGQPLGTQSQGTTDVYPFGD